MNFIDQLNTYNGLITAIATIVLVIITYIYMRETKKMRLFNEKLIKADNSLIIIDEFRADFNADKNKIFFQFKIKNIGSKPARYIEFKLLTKRSPKECIAPMHFLGTKEMHDESLSGGKVSYIKTKDALMSGEEIYMYTEILSSLLDYDKTFFLWVKYRTFYNEWCDEIRLLMVDHEIPVIKAVSNINALKEYDKSYQIPVSYR